MSHGLNAQEVDNLPHCHILLGQLTDTGDIALTWEHSNGQAPQSASYQTNFPNLIIILYQ